MKVFTFWSKKNNDVIIIVEESLELAMKLFEEKYFDQKEHDYKSNDYVIGSSMSVIIGNSCSVTIV